MLFIPLLILAIILYVIGHRVSSVLIFFFFCLNGFQIVPYPDVLFNTHLGISKPTDFAFLYVLFLCFYGLNRYRDFLPRNLLTRLIGYYTLLLLVLMGISLFYYHVPASEVVRTIRPYFLVYAYFPLRRLTYEQYNKVVYALWLITLVQSVLFVLQAATKLPFLADQYGGGPGDFIFYRYYNYPKLLYLAAYLSIFGGYPFHSPLLRKVGIALFSFVVYLTFSRAALAEYLFLIGVGWVMQLGGRYKRLLIVGIPVFLLLMSAMGVVMLRMQGGRTATDIQRVMAGDFVEVAQSEATAEFSIDADATLIFRVAQAFERALDVSSTPVGILFGKGLSVEGSAYTNANFNYYIGLTNPETGGVYQLDTGDISWGLLFLRYGFGGTLLYLAGFFVLASYFLRTRKRVAALYEAEGRASAPHSLGLALFVFMMMVFFNSLVSDSLYTITYYLPVFLFFDRPYLFSGNGEVEELKAFVPRQ